MTTWNVLTVSNTKGDPIHLGMMVKTLEDVAGFDNDCGDLVGEQVMDYVSEGNKAEVSGSWHSKYSVELDLKELSKFLGPDFSVSHIEEWDDDEPGRTETEYVNGEIDKRASTTAVPVSNLLIGVAGDALRKPVILTWSQVSDPDAEGGIDYSRNRFLLLPPETRTMYHATPDADTAESTWSVYCEKYLIDIEKPIEGSQRLIATFFDEATAKQQAERFQKLAAS